MSIKLSYVDLIKAHERLQRLEQELNAQKSLVEAMKTRFMQLMDEAGTKTYNADMGVVSVVETEIPVVKDWEAFYNEILVNRSFDLLQRRVSTTAWRSRMEANEPVPGVEKMTKRSIRIS